MPTITIRLTEGQKKELELNAAANYQNISEYVISQLFPNTVSSTNSLTHQDILTEVAKLPSGTHFSIPDLFPTTWGTYDNTVSAGRTFRIAEKTMGSAVSQAVTFISKKSGEAAIYRKN